MNDSNLFSDATSNGLPLLTWHTGPFLFGLGKKDLTMGALSTTYPGVAWEHLKQIHSAKVVESRKPSDPRSSIGAYALVEGDAHFTTVPNLAVVVKSADCVPILIACDATDRPPAVCAIHAGWRGVNTDIVQASVKELLKRGYAPTRMIAVIGPHIRTQSFEVGLDVAHDLKSAAKRAGVANPQSAINAHATDHAKRFVDLEMIVRHQLMMFSIPASQIHSVAIDTRTNREWSSYRRDGANAGRNLSFVTVVGRSSDQPARPTSLF